MSNIHETAIIDPSAKIHSSVKIGPYSIVGSDVNLGPDCELDAHVVVKGPSNFSRGKRPH